MSDILSWEHFKELLVEWPPFLVILVGDRGSGKSNLALLLAEALASGRNLDVDIVLPGEAKLDLPPRRHLEVLGDKEEFRHYLLAARNVVILIDEGLIAVHRRSRHSGLGTMLAKLSAVGRHRQVYIIITSQSEGIDKALRELADAVAVKQVSLARFLIQDKVPAWIIKTDRLLRKRFGRGIDALDRTKALWIGVPVEVALIKGIPKSPYSHILDQRAKNARLNL